MKLWLRILPPFKVAYPAPQVSRWSIHPVLVENMRVRDLGSCVWMTSGLELRHPIIVGYRLLWQVLIATRTTVFKSCWTSLVAGGQHRYRNGAGVRQQPTTTILFVRRLWQLNRICFSRARSYLTVSFVLFRHRGFSVGPFRRATLWPASMI